MSVLSCGNEDICSSSVPERHAPRIDSRETRKTIVRRGHSSRANQCPTRGVTSSSVNLLSQADNYRKSLPLRTLKGNFSSDEVSLRLELKGKSRRDDVIEDVNRYSSNEENLYNFLEFPEKVNRESPKTRFFFLKHSNS